VHLDPFSFEDAPDELADPVVLSGDEAVRGLDDRDPGAHASKELAELDADSAPAEHDHAPWDLSERRGLAVRPYLGASEPLDPGGAAARTPSPR